MSRRRYVHLAGNLSGWPKGFVPGPASLRNLDQYSSELVNGDEGGSYAPTSPIVIGPRGTPTITLSTVGSVLSGDVETVKGNQLDVALDAKAGFVLQGGAVPAFQTARTRSVSVPFTGAVENYLGLVPGAPVTYNPMQASVSRTGRCYALDPVTLGMQAIYHNGLGTGNVPDYVLSVTLPLRAQHRNATIDSIDFRMIVGGRIYVLPATMPKYRVLVVAGDSVSTLHTAAGAYDADGWYTDPAATIAAYSNNGRTRTLSYVPDQNNTAINPSNTFLIAQARLAAFGSIMLSATFNLSAIADMRQE